MWRARSAPSIEGSAATRSRASDSATPAAKMPPQFTTSLTFTPYSSKRWMMSISVSRRALPTNRE